jgi:cytochrome c
MKFIFSIVCSILLIGCGNSTQTSAPEATSKTTTDITNSPAIVEPNASAAASTPVISATVDEGTLFAQKCATCHGAKAEKSALGKSQIIANFSEQQIKDALHGYQAGTYGKEMKTVMQGQAKGLNDVQIDALSKHISSL